MKKIITLALTAITLGAFAYPLIEISPKANGSPIPIIGSRVLKSAYVINNGAKFGISESVKVKADYNLKYERPYKWIDNAGELGEIHDGFTFTMNFWNYNFLLAPLKMHKVGSDDPNEYVGEYIGPIMDRDGSFYTNMNCLVQMHIYTDIENYRIACDIIQTNGIRGVYHYPIEDCTTNTAKVADLPTLTQNVEAFYPIGQCFTLRNDDGCTTNDAKFVTIQKKDEYTYTKEYLTLAVGSEKFVITNDVNIMIPSGTKIKATSNNDQTKIGLIFE